MHVNSCYVMTMGVFDISFAQQMRLTEMTDFVLVPVVVGSFLGEACAAKDNYQARKDTEAVPATPLYGRKNFLFLWVEPC